MNLYEEKIGEISINDLFYTQPMYENIVVDWKTMTTKQVTDISDYGEEYISGYNVYASEDVKKLITFLFQKYKLYGYCPKCKKETIMFTCESSPENKLLGLLNKPIWRYGECEWEDDDFCDLSEPNMREYLDVLCKDGGYYNKYFVCGHCNRVFNISIKVEFNSEDKLVFCKIGQYPSVKLFNNIRTNRFDKALKKRKLKDEYLTAIRAYHDGYYIASYVYMRRIIEKLMTQIFQQEGRGIEFGRFCKLHFNGKIKVIKDDLPELLQDKRLYEITSAGIHQLNEKDCKEYYSVLMSAFELILSEEDRKIQENNLREELKKDIGTVHSEVKRKTKP